MGKVSEMAKTISKYDKRVNNMSIPDQLKVAINAGDYWLEQYEKERAKNQRLRAKNKELKQKNTDLVYEAHKWQV